MKTFLSLIGATNPKIYKGFQVDPSTRAENVSTKPMMQGNRHGNDVNLHIHKCEGRISP